MSISTQLRDGVILLTKRWSGDVHGGNPSGYVDETATNELMRQAAGIIDQLPQCWGLRDGKLVQDVPVVPGGRVWRIEHATTLGHEVVGIGPVFVWLENHGRAYGPHELADSREAALAAGKEAG